MIEKMKKIIVLAPSERKEALIAGIRDLGVIHITEKAAPDAGLSARLSELTKMRSVLSIFGSTTYRHSAPPGISRRRKASNCTRSPFS